jgi:hypothetical protein
MRALEKALQAVDHIQDDSRWIASGLRDIRDEQLPLEDVAKLQTLSKNLRRAADDLEFYLAQMKETLK